MQNEFIHKKTGNHYRLVTDNFMYKEPDPETGELNWTRGLILYETLYKNPDGRFFARTPEDFYANFEPATEENATEPKRRLVIEKELCQPTDAWTIPGPYYHVCVINEDTGEKTELETFERDIKEAARYAERQMDLGALEIAYRKNPDSFKSTISSTSLFNNTADIKWDFYAFKFDKENVRDIVNLMTQYCLENNENANIDFDKAFEYIKENFFKTHQSEAVIEPGGEQ